MHSRMDRPHGEKTIRCLEDAGTGRNVFSTNCAFRTPGSGYGDGCGDLFDDRRVGGGCGDKLGETSK
jgi:hypothetical protein